MAGTTRLTADERREHLLGVAMREFAVRGYDGASTERIAHAAGISQPYVFRLFGTKKHLFLATVDACMSETLDMFKDAAGELRGEEALEAIGERYAQWITSEPLRLQCQMQAYAACDDEEVRAGVRRGFGRLVEFAETVSGLPGERVSGFFAHGMLLNVITAMGLMTATEPWAQRLMDGCMKGDLGSA